MTENSSCDSQRYRFGYRLQVLSDVPEDFSLPPLKDGWLSAFFMPGDADALWKAQVYPPRIYIVTDDTLMVCSHPNAQEAPFVVRLQDLIEVSTKRGLLHGVLRFHFGDSSQGFQYNGCHQHYVSEFLRVLRSVWLPYCKAALPVAARLETCLGVTYRSWHALQTELDPDEMLYGVCGLPSLRSEKRRLLFQSVQMLPAILLAVTNRRLIAISMGAGDTDGLYETAVRSTPFRDLAVGTVESDARGLTVSLQHTSERAWRFSFEADQLTSVENFLDLLKQIAPCPSGIPAACSVASGSE